MEHKLYLNGQYLKTVDFPGFPPDVHWLFDLGGYSSLGSFGEAGGVMILFYVEEEPGLEGYYGTVDKETEKKIRGLR